MGDKVYYAHSTSNLTKTDWQTLAEHSENVSSLAAKFANDFNAASLGYYAGILHDIGKYSKNFQERLCGSTSPVDHSTAGAREVQNFCNTGLSRLLEYVIAGHHTGLQNYGNCEEGLAARLVKESSKDYFSYSDDLKIKKSVDQCLKLKFDKDYIGFGVEFFTRMLFSCLVDADFIDTEKFYTPNKTSLRGKYSDISTLYEIFNSFMGEKLKNVPFNDLNKTRSKIYSDCIQKSLSEQGVFSLTVPTGGGKTLSSMAFALSHMKKHRLKRVFYVIPYTSIIEQNAGIFKNIFGEENVLEHHSNFNVYNSKKTYSNTCAQKLSLASENWDIPIIVTTNVQFFESLFAEKPSKCRKLHNIANSVIILDEAQMLPTGYLKPCIAALSELVANYGCTVLFCTATQPSLGSLLTHNMSSVNIVDPVLVQSSVFKRVKIDYINEVNDTVLSEAIKKDTSCLCIVNTRLHANDLYSLVQSNASYYHLSARMCPNHRREKLAEIKDKLSKGLPCKVISTQLIEAGVDVDFPVVYRELSGIDSICQAAGRCNREGKLSAGSVKVFKSPIKKFTAAGWVQRTAEIGEMILKTYSDPTSVEAINAYFKKLHMYESLDQKEILKLCEYGAARFEFKFEDISNSFKLIENDMYPIVIPYDAEAIGIIEKLTASEKSLNFIRQLQGYTVTVYEKEFKQMLSKNVIKLVSDKFYILCELNKNYSSDTGLKLSDE